MRATGDDQCRSRPRGCSVCLAAPPPLSCSSAKSAGEAHAHVTVTEHEWVRDGNLSASTRQPYNDDAAECYGTQPISSPRSSRSPPPPSPVSPATRTLQRPDPRRPAPRPPLVPPARLPRPLRKLWHPPRVDPAARTRQGRLRLRPGTRGSGREGRDGRLLLGRRGRLDRQRSRSRPGVSLHTLPLSLWQALVFRN